MKTTIASVRTANAIILQRCIEMHRNELQCIVNNELNERRKPITLQRKRSIANVIIYYCTNNNNNNNIMNYYCTNNNNNNNNIIII